MDKPKRILVGSIYESDHASPGLLFWRAFYNWQRSIQKELEKFGITQVQYSILAALAFLSSDKLEVTQQQIAHQLSMDKMMVSSVVKTLIAKKLLKREQHTTDARSYALTITKSGLAKIKKCVPVVEATDEKFFQSIGPHYSDFIEGLRFLAVRSS